MWHESYGEEHTVRTNLTLASHSKTAPKAHSNEEVLLTEDDKSKNSMIPEIVLPPKKSKFPSDNMSWQIPNKT
ncbi:hypothetical protein Ddc_09145 [Ditylenchus destructor]|nr:hypothetical protein Ddc_09145 [Ditylenchus destructor]